MATVGKSLCDWGGEGGLERELRRCQVVAEEPWLDWLKAETGPFNERRLSPALSSILKMEERVPRGE